VTNFVTIEKGLGPEGRIAVVRFDRGDGINALSPEAMRQLTQAARSFEDDGNTSVVVLTGGPKAFSAGFDLKDAEGRLRKSMDLGSLRRHLKIGPRLARAWQAWNRSRSPRSKASVSVAASRWRLRSIFAS
jgi:enoyl-CoA hydratase